MPSERHIKKFITQRVRNHRLRTRIKKSPIVKAAKKYVSSHPTNRSKEPGDFNAIIARKREKNQLKVFHKTLYSDDVMYPDSDKSLGGITWKNGSLFFNNREVLYYHFQLAKYKPGFSVYRSGDGSIRISTGS